MTDILIAALPMIQPIPPVAPPGSGNVLVIMSWVMWVAGIAGVLGLIIAGIGLFYSNRQGNGTPDAVKGIGWVAVGLVVISASTAIVSVFLG